MVRVLRDGEFVLMCQGHYYGYAKVEGMPGNPGIGNFHLVITKFSHNVLNRMIRDEECLMRYIKRIGYKELISAVDPSAVKDGDIALWAKFVKIFNFEEPKLLTRRVL